MSNLGFRVFGYDWKKVLGLVSVLDLPKKLDNIWSDRSPVPLPAKLGVLRYVQRASIKTAVIS